MFLQVIERLHKGKTPPVPASELARALTGTSCSMRLSSQTKKITVIVFLVLFIGDISEGISLRPPRASKAQASSRVAATDTDRDHGEQSIQRHRSHRRQDMTGVEVVKKDCDWTVQRTPSQSECLSRTQQAEADVIAQGRLWSREGEQRKLEWNRDAHRERIPSDMDVLSRTGSDLRRAPSKDTHQPFPETRIGEAGSNMGHDEVTQRSLNGVGSSDRGRRRQESVAGSTLCKGQLREIRLTEQRHPHDSLQNELLQPENYTYKVHRSESQESSSVNMAVLAGLGSKVGGDGKVKSVGQYRWQSSDLMTGRRHWSSAKGMH